MKKLIRLMVTMAVVVSVMIEGTIAVNAAESGQCGENITWTLDATGTLTLSGSGPMYNYKDSPFNYNYNIRKIVIEQGITSIGNNAFYGCGRVQDIIIPNSVTEIGEWSLGGCHRLKSITIPNSVTKIGSNAFVLDDGLETFNMPDSVTTIEGGIFSHCNNLKSVRLSSRLSSISGQMFWYCSSLCEIVIPDSVKTIEYCAFYDCTSLKEITIPNSVISIGSEAFYGCEQLETLDVPQSVTNIDESAFGYTSNTPFEGDKKIEGVSLKGYLGSAVHAYASNNDIEFISTGTFVPNTTKLTKLKKGKKSFTVIWKTTNQNNCGYQIQYSLKSNFKGAKIKTINDNRTTSTAIKKLNANKKYYVRIRSFSEVNGTKYCSNWSPKKTITTK